jgi:hypothetical protein
VSQLTPALIVEPWGKKFTSRTPFLSQNIVHKTFRVEMVCLNFVFLGDDACLYSINCFNSRVPCATPMSHPLWPHDSRSFRIPHCIVRKSNALACSFNLFFRKHLQHTVCTQFLKLKFIRHNFVKWPLDLRKCRESDVIVNHLFSLTSSTARI